MQMVVWLVVVFGEERSDGSLAQRSLSLMDAWTPGLLGVEPSELGWCLIELRHTFCRFLLFLLRFAFSVGQKNCVI
jgi:hypothetical protein